jgi:uncharacterized metal-binding protein YceD (DUF177 family)
LQIAFKKVNKEGIEFSLNTEELNFFGKLYTKSNGLVSCKAKIEGETSHICDRCGDDLVLKIDEDIDIFISNGVYENNEKDEIDVVEFYDEIIYLDEILNSEVEALRSDYHYCNKCINFKE